MPNHVTNILKISGAPKLIDALIENLCTKKEEKDFEGNLTGKTYLQEFDFNKIIEMPESMHITSGSTTSNAIALIKAKNGDNSDIETIADYPWAIQKAMDTFSGYKYEPEERQKELRVQIVKLDLEDKVTEEHLKEGQTALDNIEKYGCKDWYSFANRYWGTKWNAYDIGVSRLSEDAVEYYFYTAWSCPFPVLDELSKQNPELVVSIQFADEDFGQNCGMATLKDGYIITQNIPDGGTMEAYKIASEIQGYDSDYFYDSVSWCEIDQVTNDDGRFDSWTRFCFDNFYEIKFSETEEPKEWILNELERMAIAREDFEYAQHIKEVKERVLEE